MIDRCHQIEPRLGTLEEILLKHTRDQYEILKSTENETDKDKLEELSSHYNSVFFHPVSNTSVFCPQFPIQMCKFAMRSCVIQNENCNLCRTLKLHFECGRSYWI